MQQVLVLGATGSIGLNTLDVLARHPDRFGIHTLTANRSVDKMVELVASYQPKCVIMACADAAAELERRLPDQTVTSVLSGQAALEQAASSPDIDVVMAAIVGFAGLRPTLAAARHGKRLLLANKEALVSAGSVFMEACRQGGATLLPIDSEHNAMFQCIPASVGGRPDTRAVEKILLTASGGPFRGRSRDELQAVTPDQACAHPNWSMGRKISVDSATLMNKGLELAEACWLFDCTPSDIDVVVHPQSSSIHWSVSPMALCWRKWVIRTCAPPLPTACHGRTVSLPASRHWILWRWRGWISRLRIWMPSPASDWPRKPSLCRVACAFSMQPTRSRSPPFSRARPGSPTSTG